MTGSLATALGATAILLLSPSFFGEHGARTADFDGPLTFFVTAGLQLLFFAVHRTRPSVRSMLAIGGLIAAGALTKSIAAFILVTGVLIYLAATGRFGRALSRWHRYGVAAVLAVAPLLVFCALREAAAPGYVGAVLYNDILGRFGAALLPPTSPFYYVKELFLGWFIAGPFLIAAPLALRHCSSREKLPFIYSASIAAASLMVYSAASNRAVQYALPMFPWLAILAALTLRYLFQRVTQSWRDGSRAQAVLLGFVLLTFGAQLTYRAADWRYRRFPERSSYPQATYGDLFAELSARGVTKLTVLDPGVRHLGQPGYVPLLRWNRLVWEQKGMTIDHEFQPTAGIRGPLASCEPAIFQRWAGPTLERIGRCAVLWRVADAAVRARPATV